MISSYKLGDLVLLGLGKNEKNEILIIPIRLVVNIF